MLNFDKDSVLEYDSYLNRIGAIANMCLKEDKTDDEDRKELLAELIKEIHIYPEGENDYPLKSIKFAFPIVLPLTKTTQSEQLNLTTS